MLSITTETDSNPDLITTRGEVSSESEVKKQNTKKVSTSQVTKTRYGKIYGDDFFLVVNFPYPAQEGSGYERLMAFDTGYITYTNKDKGVLTMRKLDYGVPCIKVWSAEEIKAAYKQAEARRKAIEEQQNAQRELATARAAAEQEKIEAEKKADLAAIEADKLAKLAAIEAEKKAKIDKIVEHYQQQAEKGVPSALQRLGEFYRDGYGVKRDPAKALEYFKKADEATEASVKRETEENRLRELAAREGRFNSSLIRANKGQIESMINVGKCYRDGNGVEKNLQKAREFFKKASDSPSKEAAKEATILLMQLDK